MGECDKWTCKLLSVPFILLKNHLSLLSHSVKKRRGKEREKVERERERERVKKRINGKGAKDGITHVLIYIYVCVSVCVLAYNIHKDADSHLSLLELCSCTCISFCCFS